MSGLPQGWVSTVAWGRTCKSNTMQRFCTTVGSSSSSKSKRPAHSEPFLLVGFGCVQLQNFKHFPHPSMQCLKEYIKWCLVFVYPLSSHIQVPIHTVHTCSMLCLCVVVHRYIMSLCTDMHSVNLMTVYHGIPIALDFKVLFPPND